jgi:hypothetical protein
MSAMAHGGSVHFSNILQKNGCIDGGADLIDEGDRMNV